MKIPRTGLAVAVGLLAAGIAAFSGATAAQTAKPAKSQENAVDLLLAGGQVLDGTGSAARQADVGIRGDRIVFLGDAKKAAVRAARVVDAKNLIVAPGFIDPHTHMERWLFDAEHKSALNYLMQGVTTVVVGNDGSSPLHTATTLEAWDKAGIGTNAALLIGHGTVRREVLGSQDVQPTLEQLEKMQSLVRTAMQEGAFGLSTGLFYVPGSFAKTEEVIALAKVAAEFGGYYDTHLRDEDSYSIGLLGAIQETIRIGREAKIPVHISHIKALGPEVWGKSKEAIEIIRKARAEGVDVTAGQYPYTASGSSLAASLLPPWVQEGGRAEMTGRLNDPALRERITDEMGRNLQRRGGAEALLFTGRDAPAISGRTLAAVAKERGVSPVEAAISLLKEAAAQERFSGLPVASFNMSEEDIANFMKQDFVMTDSDGSAGHPRLFGTYPRKLRTYVFEKHVITLPFAVHASSAMPAALLHLADRGVLRAGNYADVIAFDPETIADRATYEKPEELAVGMKYVIVNGVVAVENGQYTGATAGRALRPK